MFCGNLIDGKALPPAVALLLFLFVPEAAEAAPTPPRAVRIGTTHVLTVPQQRIDPGDRRPG
jgi:hypothetical protein